jgi:hypothetical protein
MDIDDSSQGFVIVDCVKLQQGSGPVGVSQDQFDDDLDKQRKAIDWYIYTYYHHGRRVWSSRTPKSLLSRQILRL